MGYKVNGRNEDKPRSGHPRSITTQQLEKVILNRIRRNPHRSMRKMVKELKMSRRSMKGFFKELRMRSFKRKKVRHLSALAKLKRASRRKLLLNRHAAHDIENLFSDNKLFTIEEATSSQNDLIISFSLSIIQERFKYVGQIQTPLRNPSHQLARY